MASISGNDILRLLNGKSQTIGSTDTIDQA